MGNCWSFQSNPKYYSHAILACHNHYRSHHGVPPLVLDEDLCEEATIQANVCAFYRRVLPARGGTPHSENIYEEKNRPDKIWYTPYRAVNAWYETMRFHLFDKSWEENGKSDESSHPFCRLIWLNCRKLGVGVATTVETDEKKRKTYVVCFYQPDISTKDISANVSKPSNLLPTGKPDEEHEAPHPKLQLRIIGPKKAWNLVNDPNGNPCWKNYFENHWAADAWRKYAHRSTEETYIRTVTPSKRVRKRRSAGDHQQLITQEETLERRIEKVPSSEVTSLAGNKNSSSFLVSLNNSPKLISKPAPVTPKTLFVENRMLFPDLQRKRPRDSAPQACFSFQQYYHNV